MEKKIRERIFARNFARRRFCEKDILREILREKNLILLSRTYDSNLQIRAFSHHQSIDSSHSILSIFLNLLIRLSKSIRVDTLFERNLFQNSFFSCTCVSARAQISQTFRFGLRTYIAWTKKHRTVPTECFVGKILLNADGVYKIK